MTPTAVTLLVLIAWTMTLLMSLGVLRTSQVLAGKRAANSFAPSGDDMGPFGRRLTRAHANCYENMPIVGGVLLYAIATGQTAVTDGLAYVFLAARMAQSVTHLISTSRMFVTVRFAFFGVQLAIVIIWLLRLLQII